MINYKILATGSAGNAVVIEEKILIDCGVPFKILKDDYKNLKLVLLTHIHSDHFKASTIKKLALERPSLRFGCGPWLVEALVDCGVKKSNIDVLEPDKIYGYGICNIIPVFLRHNVPNCGYKLQFGSKGKMFYATDCNNLNGISAAGYDLYLVEANYIEKELDRRIKQKRFDGEYAYEVQVKKNHLSKEKADDWLYRNMNGNSVYVYMHKHVDKSESERV